MSSPIRLARLVNLYWRIGFQECAVSSPNCAERPGHLQPAEMQLVQVSILLSVDVKITVFSDLPQNCPAEGGQGETGHTGEHGVSQLRPSNIR